MKKIKELQDGVVAYRADQLYGWPGITKLKNGHLLAISSERKQHICPHGRVVIHRSKDNGKTWDLPQEIYNSELDDRDGTISQLSDGTIIASWFTSEAFAQHNQGFPEWKARAERVTDRMRKELIGDWMLCSRDGGNTWDHFPTRVPTQGSAHSGPFVINKKELACFAHGGSKAKPQMYFYTSKNLGKSWKRHGVLKSRNDPERNNNPEINERAFLQLGPKHYLAVFRTHPPNGEERQLLQYRSRDAGKTWEGPEKLDIYGYPPHLLKMSDGRLLLSHAYRNDRHQEAFGRKIKRGIYVVTSSDNGKTWDTENSHAVDTWKENLDFGYPMTLETKKGELYTIYYRYYWQGCAHNFNPKSRLGLRFKRYRLTGRA